MGKTTVFVSSFIPGVGGARIIGTVCGNGLAALAGFNGWAALIEVSAIGCGSAWIGSGGSEYAGGRCRGALRRLKGAPRFRYAGCVVDTGGGSAASQVLIASAAMVNRNLSVCIFIK